MRKGFIFLIFFLSVSPTNAEEKYKSFNETFLKKESNKSYERNVDTSSQNECLKASDYEGCMNFYSSLKNKNRTIIEKDCIKKQCKPDEITQKTDNLGMKILKGFYFREDPIERYALYFDFDNLYKVNSKGEYGRFFHARSVIRFYSKGFEGYSALVGGGSANCSTYGSSINCNTTRPRLINIPQKAAGPRQNKFDFIYDCKDETVAVYKENKLKKWEDKKGKKKKWHKWEDSISLWTNSKSRIEILKGVCNGNNEAIKAANVANSNFYLFKDKGSKKRNYSGSKNVGNINCNSPVWKNKPRCN